MGEKDVERLVCPSATIVLVATGVEVTMVVTEVDDDADEVEEVEFPLLSLLLLLDEVADDELLELWDCCCGSAATATTQCNRKSSKKWLIRAIRVAEKDNGKKEEKEKKRAVRASNDWPRISIVSRE